jgi:hypothetical protein
MKGSVLARLVWLVGALCGVTQALYTGEFQSNTWVPHDLPVDATMTAKFIVAFALRDVDHMHSTFLDVSNPTSKNYGKYLSLEEVSSRYGPSAAERAKVTDFFRAISGATVLENGGDLFEVAAPIGSIHQALNTELGWVTHAGEKTAKKSLRARKAISLPADLHPLISFVSLNAPVNHAVPSASRTLAQRRAKERKDAGIEVARDDHHDNALRDAETGSVGISAGNQEALAFFKPYCGLGAASTNQENPPCASSDAVDMPTFTVSVSEHANELGNTYLTSQEPVVYTVPASTVYCYNTYTTAGCSGADGNNCTCIAKVTQFPSAISVLPITCVFWLGLHRLPTCPSTLSCA